MTDEPRRQADDEAIEESLTPEGEEIEITGYEAVPADAPPPAAGEESETDQAEEAAAGAVDERMAALEDDLLRVRAEFENFRKRQHRERDEFLRHASAGLMERLLPTLDNFKRAMAVPEERAENDAFRTGIDMIFKQLLDILEREGLQPIPTEGEPFDPNLHEAVAREETSEVEPNTITLELEPGYRFRDRLLKPARVRVAVAPEGES